tara:strand:+ start:1156 stop:1779 length:624 start_codon:yes stop_codon:yes gene_type:complete
MARYASGKKSKAISDISGFKVNYTDLKTTYDNLRVEPSEFDPKHPQLTPAKNVIDATALFQPRPDNDPENVSFVVGFNTDIFASRIENSQKGIGIKGTGIVESLPTSSFNFGADVTGQAGTGALGTILIDISINETGCVGTGAIGTVILTGKKIVTGVAGDGDTGTLNFKSSITEVGVAGTGAIGTESINVGGWGQEGWNISTWGDG